MVKALLPVPTIALDAADQSLAKTVDLDKAFPATVAVHLATLFDYPSLLTQRDELPRPALHCLVVGTTRSRNPQPEQ